MKLLSPTTGSLSKIEIITPNDALGIPPTVDDVVTGVDGGPIRFAQDQFRPVDIEDAYTEGARMVFIEASTPAGLKRSGAYRRLKVRDLTSSPANAL